MQKKIISIQALTTAMLTLVASYKDRKHLPYLNCKAKLVLRSINKLKSRLRKFIKSPKTGCGRTSRATKQTEIWFATLLLTKSSCRLWCWRIALVSWARGRRDIVLSLLELFWLYYLKASWIWTKSKTFYNAFQRRRWRTLDSNQVTTSSVELSKVQRLSRSHLTWNK